MDLAEYFALFSEYFDFVSPSVSNLPGVVGGAVSSPPGPRGGAEGGVRREAPNGAQSGAPRARRAPRRRRRPPASLKPMAKHNQNIQKKV